MAQNRSIPTLEEGLPRYWGETEHWEEARLVAAVAQAKAAEDTSNTLMVLAGELLERLDDIHRALIGLTKAVLAPGELELVESFDGGGRVIDFERGEEPDDDTD